MRERLSLSLSLSLSLAHSLTRSLTHSLSLSLSLTLSLSHSLTLSLSHSTYERQGTAGVAVFPADLMARIALTDIGWEAEATLEVRNPTP